MIPLKDDQENPCRPVVTYAIMGVTGLVFLWQLGMGLHSEAIFYIFGFVPGKYTLEAVSRHFSALNLMLTPISYMFFHGGFWHFLGNMWFLYIFGDNVECHLGSLRFLAFYLICGIASALCHFVLNFYSPMPTIGASGAIAGVMGAYFLLYPRAKILTLVPILIFPIFIHIPAFVFLGIWFFIQFLNAAGQGPGTQIAWWAHVGGFLAGLLFIQLNKNLPSLGTQKTLNRFTQKKRSPKLQVITPVQGGPDTPSGAWEPGRDLYGTIEVTSLEALTGAKKLVTIPWGFKRALYRVNIPAGIKRGARLRLKGMGRKGPPDGDLYLKVEIKNVI